MPFPAILAALGAGGGAAGGAAGGGILASPWLHLGLGVLSQMQEGGNPALGALGGLRSFQNYNQGQLKDQLIRQQMQATEERSKFRDWISNQWDKGNRGMVPTPVPGATPEDMKSGGIMMAPSRTTPVTPQDIGQKMMTVPGMEGAGLGILTQGGPKPTSLMQNLEAAGLQPGTPEYQEAVMQAVTKPMVSMTQGKPPTGYEWGPSGDLVAIRGGPATKPSEKAEDVASYLTSAQDAENALSDIEGWTPTGTYAAGNMLTRWGTTEENKQARDAQLMWTWSILRAESGGTVTKEEAEGQISIFWPQPGDGEETIQMKKRLRDSKMKAMRNRAGTAMQSPPPPPPGFTVMP